MRSSNQSTTNLFFIINGGFQRQKIKSSRSHEGHCSSNHLARLVFYSWGSVLFFYSSMLRRSPNPITLSRKLLYRKTNKHSYGVVFHTHRFAAFCELTAVTIEGKQLDLFGMFVKCLSEGHNEYHSIDVTENRTRSFCT